MKEKLLRLSMMKSEFKALEIRIKELQSEIIEDPDAPQHFESEFGKLVFGDRINYNPLENDGYIQVFGQVMFNKAATITVSGVKKAFGMNGVETLDTAGMLTVKSHSEYYSLRVPKK
jgi:hypothetical protein